jgi:hypothetical protein
MAINFICRCGKKMCLSDALAGEKIMCPRCKKSAVVPNPAEAVQLTPVDELGEAMLITAIVDPKAKEPEEETELIPLDEEDEGGTYGLNADDAKLEARRGTGPESSAMGFAGEVGCFKLSRDNELAQCVAYSADERQALAGVGETVHVLDAKEGKKAGKFRQHEGQVTALALSPDGRWALSGDEQAGIALWEVAGLRCIKWLEEHRQEITCVMFTPDGLRALSGARDGRLLLWDLKRGQTIACLKEGNNAINRIVFSRDGRRALSAGDGGSVRLWDLENSRQICALRGASGSLTAAALSADGANAFVARSKGFSSAGVAVWRWDLKTR